MKEAIPDEVLMLQYRDGDDRAFKELYLRHKGGLFRYLLRQCRGSAVAEELFQDIWMRVIAARLHYGARAKFSTWLYRLARNRMIDYYRRQAVIRTWREEHAGNSQDIVAAGNQPQQQAELDEQMDVLTELIDALPEDQREAFILKEEAGMSVTEIAEVTGVHAETAKSRLRYAVNKLRRGLNCAN